MPDEKSVLSSAHRQVGAIAAKALTALEGLESVHLLHPLEFDAIRRLFFSVSWESYMVGLRAGKKLNEIHEPEH